MNNFETDGDLGFVEFQDNFYMAFNFFVISL